MENIKNVSNADLTRQLQMTIKAERGAMVEFLVFLDEYDRRRAYEVDGFSSLFKFLLEKLNLSEPAAAKRIAAMRLIRRWPDIRERLVTGAIHLTGLYAVSKHLTDENWLQILDQCQGKSKVWIDEYLMKEFAAKATSHTHRDVVRPIASVLASPAQAISQRVESIGSYIPLPLALTLPTASTPEKEMRISTTFDAETYQDLKRACELIGAKDFGPVIGKALKALLKKVDPNRKKVSSNTPKVPPKAPAPAPKRAPKLTAAKESVTAQKRSRYIPQQERARVRARDAGRCAYVSPDGRRCSETSRLQFEHRVPFAKRGSHSADNIELHCPAHNRMKARQVFGELFIAKKVTLSQERARSHRTDEG